MRAAYQRASGRRCGASDGALVRRVWRGRWPGVGWPVTDIHAGDRLSHWRQFCNILLRRHLMSAERLFRPQKLGSVGSHALRKGNLMLRLCANDFSSTKLSFNKSTILHRHRVGSQTVVLIALLG
jgi:hypothetical protein